MQEFTPQDLPKDFSPEPNEKMEIVNKHRQLGHGEIITEILRQKRRAELEARDLPDTNKKIKSFRRRKAELFPYPRTGYGETIEVGATTYQVQANGEWRNLTKHPEFERPIKAIG